jgi:uncharacterized protein (DUF362 family)/Pyruvate/2-oxoacid:ferredoxin oxidoreductase delta subunit
VLEQFGGAAGICAGKKRVLLKPNVLRPALPEEAVTTHPEVIRAVAHAFLAAGCDVAVGDSPGGDPGPARPAFEKSGIAALCRDMGIPLLNFQKEGSSALSLPYGPIRQINVATPVLDAEIIVNLPKLKTHTLTQVTCALKNVYGYIPGFLKGKIHALAPQPEDIAEVFCAVWEALPPAFTLVDGIVGMQGQGPSGGEPYPAGWVLGGADPLAIDTVVAWAMGFDCSDVPLLRAAARRGLGVGELHQIKLLSARLEELKFKGFALPRRSRVPSWFPRWAVHLLARLMSRFFWVEPRVVAERCEICHRCVRSCPTGAMRAERGEVPRLKHPRACISCLCCQEVCPAKAITTRKSLFVRRIFSSPAEEEEPSGADPAPSPAQEGTVHDR